MHETPDGAYPEGIAQSEGPRNGASWKGAWVPMNWGTVSIAMFLVGTLIEKEASPHVHGPSCKHPWSVPENTGLPDIVESAQTSKGGRCRVEKSEEGFCLF